LLERAREQTQLFSGISPSHYNWIGTGAGISGLGFNFAVRQHDARAELYIDRGHGLEEENKSIFDQLYINKVDIEDLSGRQFVWERLDDRRASRISIPVSIGGYRDDNWAETHEAMIVAMIQLEASLRPYINQLQV